MKRASACVVLTLLVAASAGCAGRRRPRGAQDPSAASRAPHVLRAKRLLAEAKARTPYLPLLPEAEARAALVSMEEYPQVPNLIRILAVAPKTVDAEMAAWEAMKKESTLDKKLLNQVFWVVSSGNDCGHCMGHLVYGAEMAGVPAERLYALDDPADADPKRRAVFTFARHMIASPPAVTRGDVEALRAHLTDRQIVELAFAVCRYDTMNRLAEAMGSPLERDNVWRPPTRQSVP